MRKERSLRLSSRDEASALYIMYVMRVSLPPMLQNSWAKMVCNFTAVEPCREAGFIVSNVNINCFTSMLELRWDGIDIKIRIN